MPVWLAALIDRYDRIGFIRGVQWLAGHDLEDDPDDFDELLEQFPNAQRAD